MRNNNIINDLYDQKQQVIILGLTGKDGAGCSTVANLLNQDFNKWDIDKVERKNIKSNCDREKYILYKFLDNDNSKYKPFRIIKMSSVFFSMLFEAYDGNINKAINFLLKKIHPQKNSSEFKFNYINNVIIELLLLKNNNKELINLIKYLNIDNIIKDANNKIKNNPEFFESDNIITIYNTLLNLKNLNLNDFSDYILEDFFDDITQKNFIYPNINKDDTKLNRNLYYQAMLFYFIFLDKKLNLHLHQIFSKQDIFKTYKEQRNNAWYRNDFNEDKNLFIDSKSIKDLYLYLYYFIPLFNKAFINYNYLLPNSKKDENYTLYKNNIKTITENIRLYGIEYLKNIKKNTNNYNYDIFSKWIHEFIKVLKDYLFLGKNEKNSNLQLVQNEDVRRFVVIDSFKNIFECNYLRNKYSDFYLIAVSSDEDVRVKRIKNKSKTNSDDFAKNIDRTELPEKKEGKSNQYSNFFIEQNISLCLPEADIFIKNNFPKDENKFELQETLMRYISLMLYPGIVKPTNVEKCMQIAFSSKLNSGCISRQVGAVVTDKFFNIKAIGWNDVANNCVSCNLRNLRFLYKGNIDKISFSEFERDVDDSFQKNLHEKYTYNEIKKMEKKLNGLPFAFCFNEEYSSGFTSTGKPIKKEQVNTRALHGEERAFLDIMNNGTGSVNEGILFTTSSPCVLCSKKALHLGIKKIYYIEPYQGLSEKHILSSSNQGKIEFNLFNGAIGRAYTKLYSPIIPYKDETFMRLEE